MYKIESLISWLSFTVVLYILNPKYRRPHNVLMFCLSSSTQNNVNTNAFKLSERGGITCLSACKEGGRWLLLVAAEDCSISVRDATSSLLLRVLEGHTKPPRAIIVRHNTLYSGGDDMTLQVHNINVRRYNALAILISCATLDVSVDSFELYKVFFNCEAEREVST